MCTTVEAFCKRAIFALSRNLVQRVTRVGTDAQKEAPRDLPGQPGHNLFVRTFLELHEHLLEAKLSVPSVEFFCADDMGHLHEADLSGQIKNLTAGIALRDDTMAAMLGRDGDAGSSVIFSLTTGAVGAGLPPGEPLSFNLEGLAVETQVPVVGSGVRQSLGLDEGERPSTAVEVQGLETACDFELMDPCLRSLAALVPDERSRPGPLPPPPRSPGEVEGASEAKSKTQWRIQCVATDGLKSTILSGKSPLACLGFQMGSVVVELDGSAVSGARVEVDNLKLHMQSSSAGPSYDEGTTFFPRTFTENRRMTPTGFCGLEEVLYFRIFCCMFGKSGSRSPRSPPGGLYLELEDFNADISDEVLHTGADLAISARNSVCILPMKPRSKGSKLSEITFAISKARLNYKSNLALASSSTEPLAPAVTELHTKLGLEVERLAMSTYMKKGNSKLSMGRACVYYAENPEPGSPFGSVVEVVECNRVKMNVKPGKPLHTVVGSLEVRADPDLVLFCTSVFVDVERVSKRFVGKRKPGSTAAAARVGRWPVKDLSIGNFGVTFTLDKSSSLDLRGTALRVSNQRCDVEHLDFRMNGAKVVSAEDVLILQKVPGSQGSDSTSPLLRTVGLLQAAQRAKLISDASSFLKTESQSGALHDIQCSKAEFVLPHDVSPGQINARLSVALKALSSAARAILDKESGTESKDAESSPKLPDSKPPEASGTTQQKRGEEGAILQVHFSAGEAAFRVQHHPLDQWLLAHRKALQDANLDFMIRSRFLHAARERSDSIAPNAEDSVRSKDDERQTLLSNLTQAVGDDVPYSQALEDLSRSCSRKYIEFCKALNKRQKGGAVLGKAAERETTAAIDNAVLFNVRSRDVQALLVVRSTEGARAEALDIIEEVDGAHTSRSQVDPRSAKILHADISLGYCEALLAGCSAPLVEADGLGLSGAIALAQDLGFPPQCEMVRSQIGRWRRASWQSPIMGAAAPVKLYSDLQANFKNLVGTFGPGMEPPLSRMSKELRRLSPGFTYEEPGTGEPETWRMPWYDSLRYKFRGVPKFRAEGFTVYLSTTTREPTKEKEGLPHICLHMPLMEGRLGEGTIEMTWHRMAIDLNQPVAIDLHDSSAGQAMRMTYMPLARIPRTKAKLAFHWSLPGGAHPQKHHLLPYGDGPMQDPVPLRHIFKASGLDMELQFKMLAPDPDVTFGSLGPDADDEVLLTATPNLTLGEAQLVFFAKYIRFIGMPSRPLRWSWRTRPYGSAPPPKQLVGLGQILNSLSIEVSAEPLKASWFSLAPADPATDLYLDAKSLTFKMDIEFIRFPVETPRGSQTRQVASHRFIFLHGVDVELWQGVRGTNSWHSSEGWPPSTGDLESPDCTPPDRFIASLPLFELKKGHREGTEGVISSPAKPPLRDVAFLRIRLHGLKVSVSLQSRDAVWSCVRGVLSFLDALGERPYWERPEMRDCFSRTSSGSPHAIERLLSRGDSQGDDLLSLLLKQLEEGDNDSTPQTPHTPRTPTTPRRPASPWSAGRRMEEGVTTSLRVEMKDTQINFEGEASHGRFLLSAETGLLLSSAKSQLVMPAGREKQRRQLTLSFSRVQAHVHQLGAHPGLDVQWLRPVEIYSRTLDEADVDTELQPEDPNVLHSVFPPCKMEMHLTQQGVQESYRLVRQPVTRQRWIPFHKELRIHFPEIQASLEAQEFEILMDAVTSVALAPAPRVFQSFLYSLLPVSNSRLAKHYGHPLMPASLVALRALDCEVYRLSEEIRIMSSTGGQGMAQSAAAGLTAAGPAFDLGSSAIQRMDKWWMVFASPDEVQDQLLAELDGALNGRLSAMKQVNKLAQEADLLDRGAGAGAGALNEAARGAADFKLSLEVKKIGWSLRRARETEVQGIITGLSFWRERYEDSSTVSQLAVYRFNFLDCREIVRAGGGDSNTIIGGWNLDAEFSREDMIRARAECNPAGMEADITTFALCEVTVLPLKIRLTQNIANLLQEYFFPKEGRPGKGGPSRRNSVREPLPMQQDSPGSATGTPQKRDRRISLPLTPGTEGRSSNRHHRHSQSWDGSQVRDEDESLHFYLTGSSNQFNVPPPVTEGHRRSWSSESNELLERGSCGGAALADAEPAKERVGAPEAQRALQTPLHRVHSHNLEVSEALSPEERKDDQKKKKKRKGGKSVRWERFRFNEARVQLTYNSYPLKFAGTKLHIDAREYRGLEARWRDLLQRLIWDIIKSVLSSVAGLKNQKLREMGMDRAPGAVVRRVSAAEKKPPTLLQSLAKAFKGKGHRRSSSLGQQLDDLDRRQAEASGEGGSFRAKGQLLFGAHYGQGAPGPPGPK